MSLVEVLVAFALLNWVLLSSVVVIQHARQRLQQIVYLQTARLQAQHALRILWSLSSGGHLESCQSSLQQALPAAIIKFQHTGRLGQVVMSWFDKWSDKSQRLTCQSTGTYFLRIHCQLQTIT